MKRALAFGFGLFAMTSGCSSGIEPDQFPALACPLLDESVLGGLDSLSVIRRSGQGPSVMEQAGTPCASAKSGSACQSDFAKATSTGSSGKSGYLGGYGDCVGYGGPYCSLVATQGDTVLVPTTETAAMAMLTPIDSPRKAALAVALRWGDASMGNCGHVRRSGAGYEVLVYKTGCSTRKLFVLKVSPAGVVSLGDEAILSHSSGETCALPRSTAGRKASEVRL